jgi:intracellular multiplication protein IcmK
MPTPLPGGPIGAPLNLRQEAIDKIAPLSPKEIIELREDLDRRANAMAQPLEPAAKPGRRFLSLDLSPSAVPEVVRSSFGQGTVVTFLDAAGRPWPIVAAENFNTKGLDVAVFGANGLSLGVKNPSARVGNVAVQLEGLQTPVTFAVAVGQREVDYSVEMQLAKYLPGAAAPVGAVEQLPSLGAPEMLNYLLGTPPKTAKALTSSSPNVRAWQTSPDSMVVRTDALLASPRYSRRQSSATGVTVYEVPLMSHLILASQGQLQTIAVSGFTATREQK